MSGASKRAMGTRISAKGNVGSKEQIKGAVSTLYQAIDELERVRFLEPRFRTEEIFEFFVATAIALVLAGRVLGSTVLEVLP